MTFKHEEIQTFKMLFEKHKDQIRNFAGCKHLELWQDQSDAQIFFTYSHWSDADALETYRHSDLFKEVWAHTKPKFDARPAAWSTELQAEGVGNEMRS